MDGRRALPEWEDGLVRLSHQARVLTVASSVAVVLTGVPAASLDVAFGDARPWQHPERATQLCFGVPPTLIAAPGQIELNGTPDNDVMLGGPDTQRIRGSGGDDLICDVPPGEARLYGGRGNDKLRGGWTVYGGRGRDLLVAMVGDGFGTILRGDEGDDRYRGGPGHDTFSLGLGSDRVVGTAESCDSFSTCDSVYFEPPTSSPIVADLRDGFIRNGQEVSRVDNIRSFEVWGGEDHIIRGTAQADLIYASFSNGPVRLVGRGGDDRLESDYDFRENGGSDDVLLGGAGNDHLRSGRGDDVLRGGDGNDSHQAGRGRHDKCVDNRGNNTFRNCER